MSDDNVLLLLTQVEVHEICNVLESRAVEHDAGAGKAKARWLRALRADILAGDCTLLPRRSRP